MVFVWFIFLPGLFIRINFNSLDPCGDYMGVDISKNSSICVLNCMLYHHKKVKKKIKSSLLFLPLLFLKIMSSIVD